MHRDKFKTESLGGIRSFQTLQEKKRCTLKSKFFPAGALSFFAFCMQSCGGAGDVPDLGGSWRRRVPGRGSSLCGDLRWGPWLLPLLCVSKGHGFPKCPSLQMLSFEDHGFPHFCPPPAGISHRLVGAAGNVHIHHRDRARRAVPSLLPPCVPCSGTTPKSLPAPQTPPGWLSPQTQQLQANNQSPNWGPCF